MIYLDNAATSFPKPRAVIEAQRRCMEESCGNPGRGSHALSLAAAEEIYECRQEVVSLFGGKRPEQVAFTMNTTMALNMAIKGLLHQGDHVLLSDMEHNAVLRPIDKLAREGKITYDIFPTLSADPNRTPAAVCAAIEALITPKTRMLICAHASNICAAVQPIAEIGALCRKREILFVVDAAQSAGHLPIDMEAMQIDALCAPGHKGLLGPQGSGFLLLGEAVVADTLIEGGSGFHSLDRQMPSDAPERYEAGTLPTPAIAGLCAGIREVKRIGVEKIGHYTTEWNHALLCALQGIPCIKVYAPHHCGSVLLFNMEGLSADRLGQELDRRGFCLRAGFHCAALGHRTLQTPSGGAVRVSPGIYSTREELFQLSEALWEISLDR